MQCTPTCTSRQKVAWEKFLIYSWLPINDCVDLTPPQHTPAPGRMLHVLLPPASEAGLDPAHTAPVLGRGQGAGGQAGQRGHSRVGDMQGARLSPATPHQHGGSPGRMSIRLEPAGHRPLAPLHNQPTCQMSQKRSKTNKQQLQLLGFLVLTHYSLILETWLSGAASLLLLLLLLLRENQLPAQPDQQPPAFRANISFPCSKI